MKTPVFPSLLFVMAFLLACGCEQKKSPFDVSPTERLDPNRSMEPYPSIALPQGIDLETPRWRGIDLSPKPPVVPLSANEQVNTFVLKPGYSIAPVLSEPNIIEPAAIQFDGNGRMYVLELRTYMQDIDASGELTPVSRISRWEDKDNDGVYETGVVFLDSLVFPRFVVPFGKNTILTMESNQDHVYKYTDTNNDGKADKKELFFTGLGRSGNVEHQTSFLTWAMDNWMYSTYNAKRIRWTPDGVIQEPTGNPYGQWGVTQDNYGQVWFQDGAGGVPQNFQFPIVYGNYQVKGQFEEGFRVPYSLVKLADFEPGMRETKEDGSLNNVTGAAGNDVFRGDRLPSELIGQYFYGEPVGRIVRQVRSTKRGGLTFIQNEYLADETEFIQSTDPLFRPVDMATAPDGTLYIVDMYRGIIQQGNWTQDGSYLRTKIQQYQMDDIVGNGRIWRLSYEGMPRSKEKPRMYDESPAQWVEHLEHPNGWWRDMAQKLLVLEQDKSVVPELMIMAMKSSNELARIHAFWTLEGLGSLKAAEVRTWLKEENPQFRIQALRAAETLYKYGELALSKDIQEMTKDKDPSVAIQAIQSAYILGLEGLEDLLRDAPKNNPSEGVHLVSQQIQQKLEEAKKLSSTQFLAHEQELFHKGKAIYDGYCAACHGVKGLGTPTGNNGELIAPGFSGSPRIMGHPEYAVKILLHGLTGAIEGKEYEGVMIAMAENDDEWVAAVTSYIRNDFGNKASFVEPGFVAKVREETSDRNSNYGFDELVQEIPKMLFPQDTWKVSASSTAFPGVGSTKDPSLVFGYRGWRTASEQSPGNWFQIELPQQALLTEVHFEAEGENYPRSFAVQVSQDGQEWKHLGEAKGEKGLNRFHWDEKTQARFLRMELLEGCESPWQMKKLSVFAR